MKDEPVFPQTLAEDENFRRVGGLTKREYIATQIFAATLASFSEAQNAATACVKAADLLLAELAKAKP